MGTAEPSAVARRRGEESPVWWPGTDGNRKTRQSSRGNPCWPGPLATGNSPCSSGQTFGSAAALSCSRHPCCWSSGGHRRQPVLCPSGCPGPIEEGGRGSEGRLVDRGSLTTMPHLPPHGSSHAAHGRWWRHETGLWRGSWHAAGHGCRAEQTGRTLAFPLWTEEPSTYQRTRPHSCYRCSRNTTRRPVGVEGSRDITGFGQKPEAKRRELSWSLVLEGFSILSARSLDKSLE